jgi:hypothetical protein
VDCLLVVDAPSSSYQPRSYPPHGDFFDEKLRDIDFWKDQITHEI